MQTHSELLAQGQAPHDSFHHDRSSKSAKAVFDFKKGLAMSGYDFEQRLRFEGPLT
jgi:hypothetical protein